MSQMLPNQRVMPSTNTYFFRRSFALLRHDRGWFKLMLVLAAVQIIPVIGQLWLLGYVMEWARLIAWDVDASPKQKDVEIGDCLKSGWRSFIVSIFWWFIGILVAMVVTSFFMILGLSLMSSLFSIVIQTLGMVIAGVAALHASIYKKFSTGFRLNRIYSMLKRDFLGIVKISSMSIIVSLVITIVFSLVFSPVLLSINNDLYTRYPLLGYQDTLEMLDMTEIKEIVLYYILLLRAYVPLIAVFIYFLTVALVFKKLIIVSSLGLWMRQFSVAHWGRADQPLPLALI